MAELNLSEWRNQARTAGWDDKTLALKSVDLAQQVLKRSQAEMTRKEERCVARKLRSDEDGRGRELMFRVMEALYSTADDERRADLIRHLLQSCETYEFLTPVQRGMCRAGVTLSSFLPKLTLKEIGRRMRDEILSVSIVSEKNKLVRFAKKREKEGIRCHFGRIGMPVFGEVSGKKRMDSLEELLSNPSCTCLSVSMTSLVAPMPMIAYDEKLSRMQDCLRTLFRMAQKYTCRTSSGEETPKMILLEVERYCDARLSHEAFRRTLDEGEFLHLQAGITLQAYFPDSTEWQNELCAWAEKRVQKGGSPVKMRLVKGNALSEEREEAALHGWMSATYDTKAESDANYIRLLRRALEPERARCVLPVIATHNLFDFCYAVLFAEREGTTPYAEYEMYEGATNYQVRAIAKEGIPISVCVPVVSRKELVAAVPYFVRRRKEIAQEENFLHDICGMTSSTLSWATHKKTFLAACEAYDKVSSAPKCTQNRETEKHAPVAAGEDFEPSAYTDWRLSGNRDWVARHLASEKEADLPVISLMIGGKEYDSPLRGVGRDPSHPLTGTYRFMYATFEQVDAALDCARSASADWAAKSVWERAACVRKAGVQAENCRGELIAAMVRDVAAGVAEADAEVSAAVDFCHYYSEGMNRPGMGDGVRFAPLGAVCVVSPQEMPCASPCGEIAAALMSGNAVLFKPAPQAVYTGWKLVQCFWNAGIPKNVLQFIPTLENEIGQKLLSSPKLDAVILDGKRATAQLFRSWNPVRPVFARSGGKNSVIVTATADIDTVVQALVSSVSNCSGQKYSAVSVVILEASVYDNSVFANRLKEAVSALKTGSAWDAATAVAPLSESLNGEAVQGLSRLDAGESRLLEEQSDAENPQLYSPGIRMGVCRDSWFFCHEVAGPFLGLVRARDLDDAIAIQNACPFATAAGIFSSDEREIDRWKSSVCVSSLCVNLPLSGVAAGRRPYGGGMQSAFCAGAMMGGPNYPIFFASREETALPHERSSESETMHTLCSRLCNIVPEKTSRMTAACGSMTRWWKREFSVSHELFSTGSERNVFRYLPTETAVRIEENLSDDNLAIMLMAALQTGSRMTLSMGAERPWLASPSLMPENVTMVQETRDQFETHFHEWAVQGVSVRDFAATDETRKKAAEASLILTEAPVLANARIELLHFLREQTISEALR